MPLLVLGCASFVAWFISMLAGGGSPLVLIPLINVLLGAAAIAPVITTGMLIGNTQRALFFWKDIDWQVTKWHVPGSVFGAIFGSYVFTQIHPEGLQILIGIVLLLMVAYYLIRPQKNQFSAQAWQFLPLGCLNAFVSGIIGSTGPVMNPLYLSYGLVKEPMIATKAVNVVVMHMVKLITYLSLGVLTREYLAYGILIGLSAIPANWLGKLVLQRMSNDHFQQVVFAFVALSGMLMLWQQRGLWLSW
ncbi:TSUP family transporter [Synechococcales cyanobacterium C]|uniref:Probable membrane transporter protein n=1 Tax=Petrachloros mirabilis ULC683 TaxID=2781853 RepID=A0A8K2A2G5_9CYAN|nr:sulfite exporter TauE/SafE family protein [Petrachloros mirabilis]NCJ08387.1 TSUP family transporter [Petrachloros mirabilis ULC683]